MKLLHLLTAVWVDLAEHLPDTASSVARLREALEPRGWQVRWHVVVDGEGTLPGEPAGADTLTLLGRHIGVSCARNRALQESGGVGWVFCLDGDDEVDVPGWCALVDDPAFGSTPWHPTNLVRMDGTTAGRRDPRRWIEHPRLWAVREVEENWTSPMVFLPGNIVCRADLALAAGGWVAMRVVEDVGWCPHVNALEAGLALAHVTRRSRKWDRQTTGEPSFGPDKASAYVFLAACINANRARAGLPPVWPPHPTTGARVPWAHPSS